MDDNCKTYSYELPCFQQWQPTDIHSCSLTGGWSWCQPYEAIHAFEYWGNRSQSCCTQYRPTFNVIAYFYQGCLLLLNSLGRVCRMFASWCRERQKTCDTAVAGLPADIQSKLKFLEEDIGDVDLLQELSGQPFKRLIIFSNDLAFPQGVINRCLHY